MKLSIRASLNGRGVIDAALVRETLRIGSMEDVQRAVCDHYRIKLNQLTRKDRHKEVALPRQVAMYLARTHLGTSFPQIGALQREGPHRRDVVRAQGGQAPGGRPGGRRRPGGHLPEAGLCRPGAGRRGRGRGVLLVMIFPGDSAFTSLWKTPRGTRQPSSDGDCGRGWGWRTVRTVPGDSTGEPPGTVPNASPRNTAGSGVVAVSTGLTTKIV
ncbi:MAG: hypothetical protein IPN17_27060 [Deltaproteobacteria bacterium]|nr:hypothetical protein [Deltaproteobacteria bacterium]